MSNDFSEARKLKRFPFLDAARGLACVGVVAVHSDLEHWMRWYWGVMDFFFVMSGFLITRSLISNCDKGRGTFAFLLYRALRLLPAYVLVMLLYELAVVFFLRDRASFETLPYLLFYQNTDLIFGTEHIFPRTFEIIPMWTLVLEEQFYVVWGVFFCLLGYTKLKINLVSLGVGFLLVILAIVIRLAGVDWWALPARYDAFMMGCIASVIIFMPHKVNVPEKWVSRLLVFGWILAALSLVRLVWSGLLSYEDKDLYWDGHWIDITCYGIVSVVLVLGMVKIDIRKIHLGRMQDRLAFIGLISYEIYLVHFPIIVMLKSTFNFEWRNGSSLLFVIAMTVSTVVGYGMHRMLTAPALKKREKVHAYFQERFGSRSRSASPAPVLSETAKRDQEAPVAD
jgi:peptidoglycan/LPS O-acetylase OafA/YrhL